MKCLKCGRETDQSFCKVCRTGMEKYPVKPGAFIFIPREHRAAPKRTPARISNVKLERQIVKQKRLVQKLSISLVVLIILLLMTTVFAIRLLRESRHRPVGQNYSTVTTPTETEETEENTVFHVEQ